MPAYKDPVKLPPCPDPERYILVKTKEGSFWRRKRGTVTSARLNSTLAQNVANTKVASPAAKRVIQKLLPYLHDLRPGRLVARISGRFVKTINRKGYPDFSMLNGLEFSDPPLSRLLFAGCQVACRGNDLVITVAVFPGAVARRGNLVTDFYFEAILIYGEVTENNGLRIDSTISRLYSFDDADEYTCELNLQLPEKVTPWMALLKVTCQEKDSPSMNPRQFGMRVVAVGGDATQTTFGT